jgi:hypothetical protein
MGILDDINNMKNQGMGEKEILSALQEKGVTPKSIDEAFNQIKIKKAVSAESSGEEGMEPSIMKGSPKFEQTQVAAAPLYIPKTQEIEHEARDRYTAQQNEEIEAPAYENYNQEEYSPQEGNAGQNGNGGANYDTDTLIEIAEQVFLEKIKKEQKQINSLSEFASLAETKISNHHERIKKIEEIIDRLQAAILEKVGSYGRNLDSIKNEMGMMQESFSKMVPSLHERESHTHTRHERTHESNSEKEKEPEHEVHHHKAKKKKA